jgi:hypothetical protein
MPFSVGEPTGLTIDNLQKRQFVVRFPQIDGGMEFDYDYVKDIPDIPMYSIDTLTQKQQFHPAHYPSGVSIRDLSVTFYEDQEQTIQRFYERWRQLVVKSNGDVGLPGDYKKLMYIEVIGFNNVIQQEFEYLAFPISIEGTGMSTEDGLVTPVIKFKVEQLKIQ